MKLDKDLVREILLQVEAYPHPMGWVELNVPGHSAEEIAHHVELLDEAGFIELRISPLWTDTTGARSDRVLYRPSREAAPNHAGPAQSSPLPSSQPPLPPDKRRHMHRLHLGSHA